MKQLKFDLNGNMGGLCRLFAIPVSSFLRIRKDHSNSLNYLEVIYRDDIIEIIAVEDSIIFNEDYERGMYKVNIPGVVAKLHPINEKELERLDAEYWYVLFLDNNDMVRLAGTEENQLSFTRTSTSGQMSSRNQIDFLFSGQQMEQCAFITLPDMDEL